MNLNNLAPWTDKGLSAVKMITAYPHAWTKGYAILTTGMHVTFLRFNSLLKVILLANMMALLSACAVFTQPQDQSQAYQAGSDVVAAQNITISGPHENESASDKGWWQIGFHRQLNDEDEIQWQYDTLIAFKIFNPIVQGNRELSLWRFHRRAAVDETGHKFSFIFYASRKAAEAIYQQVNSEQLVKELLEKKHIERLSFYDINQQLRPEIENTSDPKWPLELQKTWPYFIMGVCQTWLGLVEHYYGETGLSEDADLDEQLNAFVQVSSKIDLLWKENGSHAFLHHLNALFAYQELYIVEQRLGRF